MKVGNGLFIIFVSIYFAITLLLIERLSGVPWNFHPDAQYYINNSSNYVSNILEKGSLRSFINNGFYFLVHALNSSAGLVVTVNVLIYAFSNVLLFRLIHKSGIRAGSPKVLFNILVILLLFDPYRMHLSIHVLKDTIIIFLTVLFLSNVSAFRILFIGLGLFFRQFFLANLVLIMGNKIFYLFVFMTLFFCFFYYSAFDGFLLAMNQINMNVRDVDRIPNFFDEGVVGALKRAILWPVFYLSGVFIFLVNSPLYFPIVVQVAVIQVFRFTFLRDQFFNLRYLSVMFVIALFVSSFTAYVRYGMPFLYAFLILDLMKIRRHA